MYKASSPMSRYEATLRKKYADITKKVVTEEYDQEKKDADMLKYEEKLAPFDKEQADAKKKWNIEEQKLQGVFLATTNQR